MKVNSWVTAWLLVLVTMCGLYGYASAQLPKYIQHYGDPIVPFPYKYNTVAASQTTQALTGGGGGATGDYLAGCTVIPATTTPGVVTIFDNSTAVVSFAGGTTTVQPFRIQVDSVSKNGAWKVTTGASVSVICNGSLT